MNTLYIKINGYIFKLHFDNIDMLEKTRQTFKEYIYDFKNNVTKMEIDIHVNENGYNEVSKQLESGDYSLIDTFENERKVQYTETIFSPQDKRYFIEYVNPETMYMYYDRRKIKDYDILYIIREIYVRLQENNYSLFMHGSSVEIDNNGIIILGTSGSGKTSLMYKLLSSCDDLNTGFISNDRTFLTSDNSLEYFPIPIIASNGSLLNYEELRRFIITKEDYRKKIILTKKMDSKFPITSKELSEASKAQLIPRSPLSIILISNILLSSQGVFRLDKVNSTEPLQENCFTPKDTESLRKEWIYRRNISDEMLEDFSKQRMQYVLDNYPAYVATFSPDVTGDEISKRVLELRR